MAFLPKPQLPAMISPSPPGPSHSPSPSDPPTASQTLRSRSRKQLSVFFAGAAFFGLSTLITRRALVRRYKASIPRYFQPSNQPPSTPVNGAMEAFEALNIATVNVLSLSTMIGGGLLWAFDVWGLQDMRTKLRGALRFTEGGERDAEEEFEEWLATTLARKERKEGSKEGKGER